MQFMEQLRESSALSNLQNPMIINSAHHETVKSGSMMSHHIIEGVDDSETIEQRLRLLGDMPSSSSGGTQGRLKHGEEAAILITNSLNANCNQSIREIQNTSVTQAMMCNGIFEI